MDSCTSASKVGRTNHGRGTSREGVGRRMREEIAKPKSTRKGGGNVLAAVTVKDDQVKNCALDDEG